MEKATRLGFFVLLLAVAASAVVSACSGSTLFSSGKVASQFDVRLADIGFTKNPALLSPDTLSLPGGSLPFRVDVTPKNSFTGEPFTTTQLGNKDIGFKTLVQSSPTVWVALVSKDGYFFQSEGPLTWAPEELRLPDSSERDYYKIQSLQQQRIKHITVSVPSSDKAAVALLQDSNKLVSELQQKQMRWLISGDWLLGQGAPKESDKEYIRGQFEELFNRYFNLRVVDSEGLKQLKYPNATTRLLATWSGTGKFVSPTFTATYSWVSTSWVGDPMGPFQYNLYSEDDKFVGGTSLGAEPDKKHSSGQPVKPGQRYYIRVEAPSQMKWTFSLEETNLPP